MLLKLDHPKLFSDVISIISELVLEVRLRVNKEGMSIKGRKTHRKYTLGDRVKFTVANADMNKKTIDYEIR